MPTPPRTFFPAVPRILSLALIYGLLYALNLMTPLANSRLFHYSNYTTRIWSWTEFALAGTSLGAITGALTIARWRVVALMVGILWIGAILSGLAFNWVVTWGMF